MYRKTLSSLIISMSCLSLACGTSSDTTNSNVANANIAVNGPIVITNQANLPEGISTKPVEPSSNSTPGIPDPQTVNANLKPANVPGISDANGMLKTLPKGTTPTPGIPSPEQLKKMQQRKVDISEVNDPKKAAELVKEGKGEGDPEKKKPSAPSLNVANANVKPQ
jgi:hypothetical protein